MKIKNTSDLNTTPMRKDALAIAEAGLQAIDTRTILRSNVFLDEHHISIGGKTYERESIENVYIVGIGKCSLDACEVLEETLGETITAGITVDVRCNPNLKYIKSCEGTHPMPSDQNINYTKEIIDLLKDCTEKDLVIVIISGGGSTLLCQPENHTCQQEIDIIHCLFKAGATIQEINTIRKHLSIARGGNLAKHAYPAHVVSLIFSDVPGDDLQFIASGPTVKDSTSIEDAQRIAQKYDIAEHCGFSEGNLIETPKDDSYFEKVENILLVSNMTALEAMAKEAENRGYSNEICDNCLTGEAHVVGENMAKQLHKTPAKTVLLYGGETTVTITGTGKGGRNQEVALGAFDHLEEDELILSIASDGRDNSECAGAIADNYAQKKSARLELTPTTFLEGNNSYDFFESIDSHVHTQSTGSNVSDLVIALKE